MIRSKTRKGWFATIHRHGIPAQTFGFQMVWATKMVTADEDTWDEPSKRMFATIRKGNNSWPGPPKSEHEDTINVSSDVSGLSTNSVKRRKGIAKTLIVDSSGDDKVEDVKRAARDPPKKRFRENKYDILKNGVASIVDVLRGTPSQADIKPDTKPIVPPETKPEPTLTTDRKPSNSWPLCISGKSQQSITFDTSG
ncbi:hypothetical protein H4Q26_005232 [Puccinia striiformis f. sp. tritici PST-130]|nr:hypothetical protein H4Q26_005232 [Puccinia striiformis f. sp. tritici PST-130]